MKKEIATKWIEALRSGKYKQGKSRLKKYDQTYCCLGVLCEISGLGEFEKGDEEYNFRSIGDLEAACPTKPVLEWSGLKNASGRIPNTLIPSLWELNDRQDKSFPEIADHIEKHWEQL